MILITGASKGIGKYLYTQYKKEGYDVIGTFNNTNPEDLKKELTKVNIIRNDDIKLWLSKYKLKDIILINCAGISYNAFGHKSVSAKWDNVIKVNLIGTMNVIRNVLPIMREQNYGRIINLSSIVAQSAIPGTSAYAASKSALWGLTKSISAENASKGITINNINLGYFDIGIIRDVPEKLLREIVNNIPFKRLGKPEEIVNTINYLINTEYITGTSIDLNGGLI